MTEEVLKFNSHVRVGHGAALWLEDGADVLFGRNHVETGKEVVVCQRNDVLCSGEELLEAGIEQYGIVAAHLVEHDESVR